MPRGDGGGPEMSKPEMIRDVLRETPDLPAAKVRAAVWERFGGEVTTQEIARVRQKLRQSEAAPEPPPAPPPAPARPAARKRAKAPAPVPAPRKKAAPVAIRSKDYAGAEVTVQQ